MEPRGDRDIIVGLRGGDRWFTCWMFPGLDGSWQGLSERYTAGKRLLDLLLAFMAPMIDGL